MLRHLLLVALVLVASSAAAQSWNSNVEALTVSVSTDASAYASGEEIEVRVTIANPTDSLAVVDATPGCMAWFTLGAFESQRWTPCILISLPIEFPAYSSRTTVWRLDPPDLGVPLSAGEHQLVGYAIVGEPDTTSFEAPAATGGRVRFHGVAGLTHESLSSLRDSLSAEVLAEGEDSLGQIVGEWRVHSAPLDSIVVRYQTDARFQTFEANREMLPPAEVFVAEEERPSVPQIQVSAFPNPASETIELAIVSGPLGSVTLEVFDGLGRLVQRGTRAQTERAVQIDVHDWPPGIYTARVSTGDASSTLRFTVAR